MNDTTKEKLENEIIELTIGMDEDSLHKLIDYVKTLVEETEPRS